MISFILDIGKRVQIRKAPQSIPDAVPERKRSTPINPANTIRKTHTSHSVSQRPYRDRVVHLLALKTYKKPELLARLLKDGVSQKDKNSLAAILQQVRRTTFLFWNIHPCVAYNSWFYSIVTLKKTLLVVLTVLKVTGLEYYLFIGLICFRC